MPQKIKTYVIIAKILRHTGGVLELSTTREIKVFSGQKIIQHFAATSNDKKVLQSEVSKYVRGQTYDSTKVTITQK